MGKKDTGRHWCGAVLYLGEHEFDCHKTGRHRVHMHAVDDAFGDGETRFKVTWTTTERKAVQV